MGVERIDAESYSARTGGGVTHTTAETGIHLCFDH